MNSVLYNFNERKMIMKEKDKIVANKSLVTSKKTENTVSLSEFAFEMAGAVFTALVAVLLILTFFVRQVTVSGGSMNDTLQDQDRLLVTNFMYTPQNGDIIIISHGNVYSDPIIKRVIAVGGQRLDINYDTNEVIVDGVVQYEPYIKGRTRQLSNSVSLEDYNNIIPEGYVFVMGDNREGSLDSRSKDIGLIPVNNIIGKAQFRFAPFDKFGTVYYNA